MEETFNQSDYPDYRTLQEEEMYLSDRVQTIEENNNPINHPEGFKILDARVFQDKNGKDYKQVHLEDEKGNQHTALVFPTFSTYEQIITGNYVDGYIRVYNSYFTLVEYSKPERTLLENEKFIYPNGEIKQK
jgi:hypothetical protein